MFKSCLIYFIFIFLKNFIFFFFFFKYFFWVEKSSRLLLCSTEVPVSPGWRDLHWERAALYKYSNKKVIRRSQSTGLTLSNINRPALKCFYEWAFVSWKSNYFQLPLHLLSSMRTRLCLCVFFFFFRLSFFSLLSSLCISPFFIHLFIHSYVFFFLITVNKNSIVKNFNLNNLQIFFSNKYFNYYFFIMIKNE